MNGRLFLRLFCLTSLTHTVVPKKKSLLHFSLCCVRASNFRVACFFLVRWIRRFLLFDEHVFAVILDSWILLMPLARSALKWRSNVVGNSFIKYFVPFAINVDFKKQQQTHNRLSIYIFLGSFFYFDFILSPSLSLFWFSLDFERNPVIHRSRTGCNDVCIACIPLCYYCLAIWRYKNENEKYFLAKYEEIENKNASTIQSNVIMTDRHCFLSPFLIRFFY